MIPLRSTERPGIELEVQAVAGALQHGIADDIEDSGLTGFVAGLARETVGRNVTINNLLPGPFDTDRLRATNKAVAAATGRSVEDLLRQRLAENPAGRFGDPAEFGAACAFLCSAAAGFITGQNFLIDGGAYPGVF